MHPLEDSTKLKPACKCLNTAVRYLEGIAIRSECVVGHRFWGRLEDLENLGQAVGVVNPMHYKIIERIPPRAQVNGKIYYHVVDE